MIHGIVLSAGLGRRIGEPKALLRLFGETFHQRAVRSFRQADLEVTVVVNRAVSDALPTAVRGERRVINLDPDQGGMFSSVRMGVAETRNLGASAVILLPVDLPLVTSADIQSVASHLGLGAAIVVATYAGRRGHPIGLSRVVMDEMLADSSASTLREIVHRDRARVIEVVVSEGAILGVNTREDLDGLSNHTFR